MSKNPVLIQMAVKSLLEAREALRSIPEKELSGQLILTWLNDYSDHMRRADPMIRVNAKQYTAGFSTVTDKAGLQAVRERLVDLLNRHIDDLDATRVPTKPELDQLIDKVTDVKLKTMLTEFRDMQASQPNSAAIVLRTILGLIIKQRAKKQLPLHRMAASEDLDFFNDVRDAIGEKIFNSGQHKLLNDFNRHLLKATYDNITHKAGDEFLMKDPKDLAAGIELVTKLLHDIVP